MRALATITPSANIVVEATTIAMLRDLPGLVPVFSRTPVPDGLPDTQDWPNILRAAELLATAKPAAILWNGSKGGVIGLEADRELTRRITGATGIPADTSALALERALTARGATRLGLITPYDDAYTARLLAAFARQGWAVAAESHLGMNDNLAYASVAGETIRAQAREVAPHCDLILAWCTNYPAGFEAAAIEREMGKPCWDATALGVVALLRAGGVVARPDAALWGSVVAG
jgi:maleate isomerase